MARLGHVDPTAVTDPELAAMLWESPRHGTPRLEHLAIRARVPALRFSPGWQESFARASATTG